MTSSNCSAQFSSVQSLSCVRLFAIPWIAACQASLSITNSQSPPKPMLVMPSKHLILCHPLLLPSIFPSIRVFSNESALCIRWPKYWSFSFNISPSNEYPGLISKVCKWKNFNLFFEKTKKTKKPPKNQTSKYWMFLTSNLCPQPSHTCTKGPCTE